MTLETIFDNIEQYQDSIDDLLSALRSVGVSSLEEFNAARAEYGVAVPRSIITELRDRFDNSETEDWNAAVKEDSISAYQDFLRKFPMSEYAAKAREAIQKLSTQEEKVAPVCPKIDIRSLIFKISRAIDSNVIISDIQSALSSGGVTVDELMYEIGRNTNLLNAYVIQQLLSKRVITEEDLVTKAGIPWDVIEELHKPDQMPQMTTVSRPDSITLNPCTEVYFWGIPSSGKTCAMGAIMSTVTDGVTVHSCEFVNKSQGYGYMTTLKGIFKDGKVTRLPAGTPVFAAYEMGMVLSDNQRKRAYPVTCIDLAGETINSMYKHDIGEALDEDREATLTVVSDLLMGSNRTKNRKKHFFVIEYGAEERTYDGRDQDTCLGGALNYIKSSGILKNDTDGIYILITKVDSAGLEGDALKEELRDYIKSHYQGFYNRLDNLCKEYEINGGRVEIQPFSIGDVYFNKCCRFNKAFASDIARMLMTGYSVGTSKVDKLIDKFRK